MLFRSIKEIEYCAFAHNKLSGDSFKVPNGVRRIGEGAFMINNIGSITLPDSVETVDEQAFAKNPHLKTASIGKALKYLHKDTFYFKKTDQPGRPKITVNIRGGENPHNLSDSDYHEIVPPKQCGIYLDSNGGTPSSSYIRVSARIKFQEVFNKFKPTKKGFYLAGWATTKGATEPNVKGYDTVTDSTTLYAVWKGKSVKVTFDANGGINPPSSVTCEFGKSLGSKFPSKKPTNGSWTFLGWATKNTARKPDFYSTTVVNQESDIKVYAVWNYPPYMVAGSKPQPAG